ncbi:hypothetical protein J437_LFUL001449 [Ladona fulva]|uniref:Uncharacterized protein n=1 Tax=Ladona fulva TaxID=123851 RepID=A0A8K0JTQ4_LADFU|nr:hypothetical protein J437_LFUL001449 [Ladona fulva]
MVNHRVNWDTERWKSSPGPSMQKLSFLQLEKNAAFGATSEELNLHLATVEPLPSIDRGANGPAVSAVCMHGMYVYHGIVGLDRTIPTDKNYQDTFGLLQIDSYQDERFLLDK